MSELVGALPLMPVIITRDQLIQLQSDNVVADDAKTLADLGIHGETVEAIVPSYLERYRHHGQFHEREA